MSSRSKLISQFQVAFSYPTGCAVKLARKTSATLGRRIADGVVSMGYEVDILMIHRYQVRVYTYKYP